MKIVITSKGINIPVQETTYNTSTNRKILLLEVLKLSNLKLFR